MITVSLGSQATIQDIGVAYQALTDAFAAESEDIVIVIDADALAAADFSLVQLMEAARLHAQASGRVLRLGAPANPVLAGVLAKAGLPQETPAERDFWFHGACQA